MGGWDGADGVPDVNVRSGGRLRGLIGDQELTVTHRRRARQRSRPHNIRGSTRRLRYEHALRTFARTYARRRAPSPHADARFGEAWRTGERLRPWVFTSSDASSRQAKSAEGPMFGRAIPVDRGEVVTREGFVFADLLEGA